MASVARFCFAMKTLVTVILILACVGLVVALVVTQKNIDEQKRQKDATIAEFSNDLVQANDELTDLRQVNLSLTNDLNASRQQLVLLSNQVLSISDSLSNSDTQLKAAEDQISTLQAQNQSLDDQAAALTNTIMSLNAKILAAQTQLADSEKNSGFLQSEVSTERANYAALQAKFNDLKAVRDQAKKLHNELVVARRLQWIREGTQPGNNMKGATALMARSWPTNTLAPASHYNLSVEVDSSGGVHIVNDTNAATSNAPQ
jgi:septal ring factor EnvC (AmiA/AmiB activator)